MKKYKREIIEGAKEMNTQGKTVMEYLKIFDMVMAHTFDMYKKKQDGPVLPVFMEYELYEKARIDTLHFHRQGLLVPFYERLKEGTV